MGREIDRHEFAPAEYERFGQRLRESIGALRTLLARPGFGEGPPSLGAELEVSLVDASGHPLRLNREVLAESLDPRLTVELDRFNLESNLRHGPLAGGSLASLRGECEDALAEMRRAAARHGARVATIGILPTLERSDFEGDVLTDSDRYRALATRLRRLREAPFSLDIHGEDHLQLACEDVSYEGAGTSLQVHLRVSPADFADLYNAVQLTTPLVLAVSANSPTFLGRRLWDETRVALFKQAVDDRPERERGARPPRVSFGGGWIGGPLETFAENVEVYEPLLPILDDERPLEVLGSGGTPRLRELRLHQGTVWRWNRGIYDPAEDGHLRIEMRSLPSGPTVVDMLASLAFHVGLALGLRAEIGPLLHGLPFEAAHRDFYRAAREGLDAELHWPRAPEEAPERLPVPRLVERLLPRAQAGLDAAGVDPGQSRELLAVVEGRARSGRTGAVWQRRALAAAERTRPRREALVRMFAVYQEHSLGGRPVAEWPEGRA